MQFDQSNTSATAKRADNKWIHTIALTFIAKFGRPQTIYSDNEKTGAANWIKKVVKNETVHNFFTHQEIKWKFNLSRAPWTIWEG